MTYRQLCRSFEFFRPLGWLISRIKFNFHAERFKVKEGPCLVLSNHIWAYDMIFLGVSLNRGIRFVASEHVFRKGLLAAFVRAFFDPISKQKGAKDIHTVRQIIKALRAGECVGLYPEGNCSHDGRTLYISPATGKLAKAAGADILLYTTEQGYLASPRWAQTTRKGRLVGSVKQIITKEEAAALTAEQLTDRIRKGLYCDALPLPQRNTLPFKGKNLAECAERAVFICPQCKKIGTLHSSGNRIFCESCGAQTEISDTGYFTGGSIPFEAMWQWDNFQREYISAMPVLEQPVELCRDEGETLWEVRHDGTTKLDEGTLVLYTDRIEFSGAEKRVLPFEQIGGVTALDKQTLSIVIGARSCELKNTRPRSAIKYMYLINYFSQKQRGEFNGFFGI